MSDILSILSVIFFGGWLGIGIRWGFWIWDIVSEAIRELPRLTIKRHSKRSRSDDL